MAALRHGGILTLVATIMGASLVACPLAAQQEGEALPEVVAEVNGQPITRQEWVRALVRQAGQRVLDQLIDERIVEQALRERAIQVPAAEVEERLRQIREQVGEGQDLRQWLEAQGTDAASFRRWLELDLGVEELVRPTVRVTDEDVQWRYLQENRRITLYHVFVKNEAEAREYRDRLLRREMDFLTLMRTLAPDALPLNQKPPTFNYDALPAQFAEVAFRLRAGEVSEPVKTEYGYYLLYVSKVEDPPPIAEAERQRIEKELHRQRLNEAKQEWLQQARRQARVQRHWLGASSTSPQP